MSKVPPESDPTIRADAWLGDAILALYVRELLLELNRGLVDGDFFVALTSNDFLRLVGNATLVEAQIGVAYRQGGLSAAFEWIKTHLRPQMDATLHALRRKRVK